jgi:hypothetical protein
LLLCSLKKLTQGSFPPSSIRRTSAVLNASMVTERTKEMCTPSERWIPEHARQKKMPNLGDAYVIALSTLVFRFLVLLLPTYPLRARCSAVDAFVVAVGLCDGLEFAASLWVDLPHLIPTHLCGYVESCRNREPLLNNS